jgi:hypothetical protein
MARTRSGTWTVIISLLIGITAATAFWQYSPYGHEQAAQQSQPSPGETKGGPPNLKKLASQAASSRFQMVTDSKQVFVVDLQNGRVWRYFHQTKEEGFSREDEGFLPVPFYFAGKKHYTATDIEPPAGLPGNPSSPEEKQPQ